jgi:hypothetical protein
MSIDIDIDLIHNLANRTLGGGYEFIWEERKGSASTEAA